MMLQGGGIPPNISSSGDGTTGTGGSGSSSHLHDTTNTTITATLSTGGGAAAADIGSGSGGYSEDERGRIEDSGRNSSGNRWPRQETLALLQIRSDMDVAFRDSSLKGPLWDEVSRKLAELGYHRSAKKCKEKFENVYKYHKRTKEGRTSKADGKTYRFFDQLQALEGSPAAVGGNHQPPVSLAQPPPVVSKPPQLNLPMPNTTQIPSAVTPISIAVTHQNNVDPISVAAPAVAMPSINHVGGGFQFSQLNMSNSSSSSTSSDDEPPERRNNRKRKWKDFFGKLMKEVISKQEELQSKFLETLERRERDRIAREEAWRMQELAKMKQEHELLLQERSMVAAKDAAVISFLQKITEQNPNAVIPQVPAMQLLQQQQHHQQQNRPPPPPSPSPPPPPPPPQPVPAMQQPQQKQQPQQHQPKQQATQPLSVVPIAVPVSVPVSVPLPAPAPPPPAVKNLDNGGGGDNMLQPSPSRWPKAEINALISLRTTLDTKYQESGPKGPLWEEISLAMRKLGYNRNAKRCKEKWENINKYYKKVKESSKKRPEDSKTCPYFHQLDAIYREKATTSINPAGFTLKPETTQMAPIMARPEQQWPLPTAVHEHQQHQYQHQHQEQQHHEQQQQSKTNEHANSENHENDDDYDDDEDDDEDEDEEGGDYEIVPNKTSSMAAVE